MKETSNILKLNYSTAKSIIRKYRMTGKMLSLKNEVLNDHYQIIYESKFAKQ